jgi:hypothetical protein
MKSNCKSCDSEHTECKSTNYLRIGLKTISIYFMISMFSIFQSYTHYIADLISFIVSIVSIILWHESIKKGMKQSIKNGILISLFFMIPYSLLMLLMNEKIVHNETFNYQAALLLGVLYSSLSILSSSSITNGITSIYQPLIIICILIIINIIIKVVNILKPSLYEIFSRDNTYS